MPETQGDDDFPFAAVERTEGTLSLLRNPLYGIEVLMSPGEVPGATFHKVSRPLDDDGTSEIALAAYDTGRAQSAYAELWLRAAAVDVGLGFHPDTPADGYAPPLEAGLAAQYDAMIGFCHRHLEDPYATALGAWEAAGLVPASPGR